MELKEQIDNEVVAIFKHQWSKRDGIKVPDSVDLQLCNDAVCLNGTVLYADLSRSTNLVDEYSPQFAAEIYKSYLLCASRIIKSEGGEITAYDGDRVMAVFIGDLKNTSAVGCALRINYAVNYIINPKIKECYPKVNYSITHVVGIDTSDLFIARTGIRGANDLVWVGRAANYAAKLSSLSAEFSTRITSDVFNVMNKSVKYFNGEFMWEKAIWNDMGGMEIYRSKWWWKV